jgi:curved DNA-binding protein CbpA
MAQRKPLDLKGYYRLLKIASDASPDEVRLAYAMAKSTAEGPHLRRIEDAYAVLKDPRKRAAYDKEGQKSFEPLKSPATLAVAAAALIGVFVWLWLPEINLRRKSFRPGQTLVEIRSGRPFGEVVRYEASHSFPGGSSGPAYLVKLGTTGSERWFPAIDLQATCDGR